MEMPVAPPVLVDTIPSELKEYDQWVAWTYTRKGDGYTKVPINPHTGQKASSTNPDTWSDFETAHAAVDRWSASGVGFVFTDDDPFIGVDVDKAVDEHGVISAVPAIVLRSLASYTERSPSGRGFHSIIRGILPEFLRDSGKSGKKTTAFECYASKRFFTVSGRSLPQYGTTIKERTHELGAIWPVLFPEKRGLDSAHDEHAVARTSGYSKEHGDHQYSQGNHLTDDDIIRIAGLSKSGPKFDSLFYRGDTSGHNGDDSGADQALCNMLNFYAHGDYSQIERLWGISALGRRAKYHREDYRRRTIESAIEDGGGNYYSGGGEQGVHFHLGETVDPDSEGKRQDHGGTRRLVTTRASDIDIQPITWLWPGWLSLGKIHVLGGAPGDGKSTLSLDLAARLSRGAIAPDGKHTFKTCNTIIMASEDGAGDTIAPNLKRFGADMDRIFHVSSAMQGDKEDVISLHDDLYLIEQAVVEHDAKFVIIDPITNYTGNSDNNSEKDVRRVLMPVKQMAERLGVSVLCIMHVSKPGGSPRSALQSLMGSTAFGGVARTVWMNVVVPTNEFDQEAEEPEPEEDGEFIFHMDSEKRPAKDRVLGVIKSNIDEFPQPLSWSRGKDGPVDWHGTSPFTVEDVLAFTDNKTNRAMMLMRARLRNGPVASTLIEEEAKAEGISLRTLKIARTRLGVKASRGYGENGGWMLSLPQRS